MTKADLKQEVEKHAKHIKVWVRQAPFGANYAPRSQANGYPSPSYSQNTPSKHKTTDGAKK